MARLSSAKAATAVRIRSGPLTLKLGFNRAFLFLGRQTGFQGLSAVALHSCSGRQVAPKVAPAASRSSAGLRYGQASSIPAASPLKTIPLCIKTPFSSYTMNRSPDFRLGEIISYSIGFFYFNTLVL